MPHQRQRLFSAKISFEDRSLAEACGDDFHSGGWFGYYPALNLQEAQLISANRNSGTFLSENGTWSAAACSVKFVRQQNGVGIGFEHLDLWPSELQIDQIIEIVPLGDVRYDTRYQRPLPTPNADIR